MMAEVLTIIPVLNTNSGIVNSPYPPVILLSGAAL